MMLTEASFPAHIRQTFAVYHAAVIPPHYNRVKGAALNSADMRDVRETDPTDWPDMARRLREERLRRKGDEEPKGLLKELAELIGTSTAGVQQYETGLTRPRPEKLERWVRHLAKPAHWVTLYMEWRALDELEALVDKYGVEGDYRSATRLAFRDGMRSKPRGQIRGAIGKKRAAGSSR